MIIYLQITAIICLAYAIKSRMQNTNIIGYAGIVIITLNSIFIESCNPVFAFSLTGFVLMIVIYDFIKGLKNCKNTSIS